MGICKGGEGMTIELARALTNSLGITINSEDAPRLYANLQNIVSQAAMVEREACALLVKGHT